MSKPLFRQALERYGKKFGLSDVQYEDVRGTCFLFKNNVELFLLWNDQPSCVFAAILCGRPAQENRSELFLQMLHGNHFWSKTSGATLCYDKEQGVIFLIDKWGVEVVESDAKFAQKIANFVDAGSHWKMQIEGGKKTVGSDHSQMAKDPCCRVHGLEA